MRTTTLTNHSQKLALMAVVGLLLNLALSAFSMATLARAAGNYANDAFQTAWEQLDGPVAAGQEARPYLWGTPGAIQDEDYREAKNGKRQVQYFAKGRMELTRPDLQPGFVGDGRLVLEMVTGRVQTGDNLYLQYDGAESPVAGSGRFAINKGAPSYRAFQSVIAPQLSQVGNPVNLVLPEPESEGFFLRFNSINRDLALGSLSKYVTFVPETSHSVPDVFWNYLNQPDASGVALFNWQSLFGLPITDAYWVKVRGEDGSPQDVMIQLYERRTLLFNPAAPAGFQVESGNVGDDYYRWRYQQPELPVIEEGVEASSGSGAVQPATGESGTVFVLTGSNFKPNESTSAWLEQQQVSAGPNAGRGIFEFPVKINDQGKFRVLRRTRAFTTTSRLERLVVIGNESGNKVVLNLRIIGSIRYTPYVEAIQPTDVPANVSVVLRDKIVKASSDTPLDAEGFQPNEPLSAWVTTPLNRVVSWFGLSFSSPKLVAGKDGHWKVTMRAPGVPEPGIYALTIYGRQSGKTAYAYFRVRTNTLSFYNPTWGSFDPAGPQSAQPVIDLANLPLDPALQDNGSNLQDELVND